eukprot:10855571-Ditylum_brightwellii.AAC.1
MGIVKLPCKSDYWHTNSLWPQHSIMTNVSMTQDCFAYLWQHLHLSTVTIKDVETEKTEEGDDVDVDAAENILMLEPLEVHHSVN